MGGLRPGQEFLKYARGKNERLLRHVEMIPTRISDRDDNEEEEIQHEENMTRFVPSPHKKRVVVERVDTEDEPFFRGHFGLVGTKKSICTSPIVRKETVPRRQRKSSRRRVVKDVKHTVVRKEKTFVSRAVLNNEDDDGDDGRRRIAVQQQLCKWGDDVDTTATLKVV